MNRRVFFKSALASVSSLVASLFLSEVKAKQTKTKGYKVRIREQGNLTQGSIYHVDFGCDEE